MMKLIVGLGNPGEQYLNTRHNVGFMVVDAVSQALNAPDFEKNKDENALSTWVNVGGEKIVLLKPQTYMNESGISVMQYMRNHAGLKSTDIYVIHDDLDILLGQYKIQLGVGPKDHGGINSIQEKTKLTEFWRVRVGVENRDPHNRIPGETYVLQKFNTEELQLIKETVEKIVSDIAKIYGQ